MRIERTWVVCLGFLLVTPALALGQANPKRHVVYNQQLIDELTARDSVAARAFASAIQAQDVENYARAAAYYAEVRERVPTFVHATRRLAMIELALGHTDSSIDLARLAVDADSSKENLSALANALSTVREGETLAPQHEFQALSAAEVALAIDSTDIDVIYTACRVALICDDKNFFTRSVGLLERHMVEESEAHYYLAVRAAGTGHYDRAQAELRRARELGMPREEYEKLAPYMRPPVGIVMGEWAGWIAGLWAGTFLLLLALGWLLSRITLARSGQIPASRNARVKGADAFERRLYAFVLNVTCLYYYLSIPLLVVAVVGLVLGLVYAFITLGHVPIKLVVIIVIVGYVTVSAILRSLFVRAHDQDPGAKLDLAAHPRLRQLLDQVASVIGTRTVDNVYMTPGAEMAVMERGGSLNPLRRRAPRERCLILGAGVLDGMPIGSFKAILGHEYGHFSNRDTAGGQFALAVRRSLYKMAHGIAAGGAAAWYNPAWLFIRGFHRVFLIVSQGASRLQEVLADRWAVFAYGSDAFVAGLRHVVEKAVHSEMHIQATLKEVIEQKRALANLYAYVPSATVAAEEEEKAVEEALHAKASPFDSHPPPVDRIAWAQAVNAANENPSMDDKDGTWALFSDRDQIERSLTAGIRSVIHDHYGIDIAAQEGEAPRVDDQAATMQSDTVSNDPPRPKEES